MRLCAGCGNDFETPVYFEDTRKFPMEFCSPECKHRHDKKVEELRLRLRMKGDDNYFFVGKEVV